MGILFVSLAAALSLAIAAYFGGVHRTRAQLSTRLLELETERVRGESERKALLERLELERQTLQERAQAERTAIQDRGEAERAALQARNEAERQALTDRNESERQALAERNEAERLALLERIEAERLAHSERAESELRAARERFELEQSALRARAEAALQAEKERGAAELTGLRDRLGVEREKLEAFRAEQVASEKRLRAEFENLARQILDTSSTRLRETSEKNFQTLIAPLKEQLEGFTKKVDETYQNEARERFALGGHIERLVQANLRITTEAENLTRALKADVKVQGNWGEMILERILSESGLREGHDYVRQGEGMGLRNEDGEQFRPDVIVNLPEGKHLVVDSKVSLKAYEQYRSAEVDEARDAHLKQFVASVYRHVDGLSGKRYQGLEGLRSPDFVFLFMPLEAAFSLALSSDPELVLYAWRKRVAFVSPTTLLATLETVASLWKTERQNRNALEIAERGGRLYDKFVDFVSSLEKVGQSLDAAKIRYDEAFGRLRTGRGHLVGQAEKLRQLGAKTSKNLSARLAVTAPESDSDDALAEDATESSEESPQASLPFSPRANEAPQP
jgi:DNA recombination protein RmuC